MSEARCSKPGCGALRIVGQPCYDWSCPQRWVSAADFATERAAREKAERAIERLEKMADRLTEACTRWGWSNCTTEVELIESIDDLMIRAAALEREVERLDAIAKVAVNYVEVACNPSRNPYVEENGLHLVGWKSPWIELKEAAADYALLADQPEGGSDNG